MIECVFAVNAEVVYAANPFVSEADASGIVPSKNVTVSPSGMLPKVELTVAVNVTACPMSEGEPDVVTLVVLATGKEETTDCFRTAEVLPLLFPSPEYTAVME